MAKVVQFLGLFLVVAGISGTVDQLASQPFLSPVLNFVNHYVIPHMAPLQGYEVICNLSLSVVGSIMVIVANRPERSEG
ncbi:hypothetical protein RM550_14100 [Streptomyces sp. DSM 41527]|uniref:Uncharacterized protein n=1 Tax=Streptomyces mooreae TaxID=3075523 RepID=A0ABU2T7Q0_9ACTN|nr:hypothetical protein [Streptomyces sp. DSM 41527]MDT0456856.1 hypothetical protein [Streptomyces sp. DSM 41527]